MKNALSSILMVGTLVSSAALRSVNAEDIAIANASFEEPALADGAVNEYNMPGWVGAGIFAVVNPRDDWFFGTSAGSTFPNPIDGLNIGGINTGGTIHQDLTASVQPGVTYTLNMLVGKRLGIPFGNPTVSLIANGQVLAEGIPAAPADGRFAPFQLTYDSPTNGPDLGQTLRIQLKSAGTDAQPWFDNLKLTNGPPPPPSSGSGIAIANASFEQPMVADGLTTAHNMPGWVGTGTFAIANPRDDWFLGTSAESAPPNPIDGLNIGGINTGGTIHQDLTATVQPDLTYTLTMLVGHRLGVPFGTLTVSLIANGQVLAEGIPPAPEAGRFTPFQLTYISPTNGPVLGQTLRIQLKSSGANAQPWFDNLKLTNGPPPPPPGSEIVIANASFEEPTLADGSFNSNDMPGWVGAGTFAVANPRDDWFLGTSAESPLPNPIDGLNIGGINTGGTIHQNLTAVVQPGVVYTLTMMVGRRLGHPFGTLTVSLTAGGQILAEGIPAVPEAGHFVPFQLTYSSPTSGPALGQSLRIQLKSTGTNAQAWFDNVKLTNGPPPPPSGSDIAIANASFEEPAVADGTENGSTMPGWVGVGTFAVANPRNDWFFGTSAGSVLPNPIDGSNIGGINTGGTIHQDLTASVQPGVTYSLNMLVGHRLGVPFGTLTVSLMAGGQVLAEGLPSAPQDGRFASFQLAYNSPTNGLVLGQTLRIQLKSSGANAQPWFDNLKLTVIGTPVELAPFITAQPQSQPVIRGDSVVFRVEAFGSNPLFYQWFYNETEVVGATNSSLALENVQLSQSGNYSVAVSNALGTVTSSNAVLVVNHPPATVRVVDANGAGAAEISVPVELVANGNENALGFSLSFNPAVLGFVGASVGVGAPSSAALLVNTNDVAAGRLGLAVGLPADGVFPEGTQQVALVTFLVAPILNQVTVPISFGNQPTLRQLSDVHAQVLPAVFVGGTVSIVDSHFEGDVASRPNGDRSMSTIDWVQMGRFVARLDTISSPNEFQRADCAPRSTKGNGLLTASDWVQAGRYAVGLDPLTVLGGPTEESNGEGGGFAAASASVRQLSLVNTSIAQGQTNTVPVTFECLGNENAATFSVSFDTSKLAFVSATPGLGSAGGLLNLNTSEVSQGRLGVAMAAQPGLTFAPGTREILKLQFSTLVSAPATTTLNFGNLPVPREVSDVAANALPTDYTPGTVNVTPPPGPPLRVTRTGNSLFITWPSSAMGFELEGTAGALGSAWNLVPGVIDLGEQKLAIVPIGSGERYFRLKKP